MVDEIDNNGHNKEKAFVYKARDQIVEIYSSNLKCLAPEKYLDDSIIRFFVAYLLKDVLNPKTADRIHVFDNLFHSKIYEIFGPPNKADSSEAKRENKECRERRIRLEEAEKLKKWKQLSKWFRGIDLFEKSYLIFPICQEEHWFSVIVCYPGEVADMDQIDLTMSPEPDVIDLTERTVKPVPGVLVLDSLGLSNYQTTREIREFLDLEWRARQTTIKSFSFHNLPQYHPRLPTQNNAYDCGPYTLAYLKEIGRAHV